MAISGHAIVANMTILLKLAKMALVIMVINMVNIGVYAKNTKSVDYLQKRIGKYCVGSKVMAKTKYFVKKGLKMADFLCILVRKLKFMATGLGWWENSDFFFL